METFEIFSNLAFISNKGMLNQVIAVITAVLGHFDDHGNQLTTGKDFSSDRTLRVHQSDTICLSAPYTKKDMGRIDVTMISCIMEGKCWLP